MKSIKSLVQTMHLPTIPKGGYQSLVFAHFSEKKEIKNNLVVSGKSEICIFLFILVYAWRTYGSQTPPASNSNGSATNGGPRISQTGEREPLSLGQRACVQDRWPLKRVVWIPRECILVWQDFHRKLHESKRNWTGASLAPPMATALQTGNTIMPELFLRTASLDCHISPVIY